ncbi:MAG TPA: hypothetical protein VHL80_10760 [Polyangia bacterium]|nr:hypothetical protein [Polyangia bacterium]
MALNELHPEELLAKASRGVLGAGEAADLRAHCVRCPACALQIELRGELEGALAPTALDYELGARAVERLFASGELGPARTAQRDRGPRRAPPLATRVALVLALVLGTSVVASAFVLGARGRLWDTPERDSEEPHRPAGHARRAGHAHAQGREVEPSALEEAPQAAAPPAPAPTPAASAPSAVAPPAVAPLRALVPAAATARARPAYGTGAVATDDAARAKPDAAALFGAAERAREDGDFVEARRLYGQLASRYRGTREELSARVLGGQMLLDDLDQPAAALSAFDRYLRDEPGGTLAEEAIVGRAQALRRLGRADAEAAAWSDLLARHPRSVHAELARERLAALVAGP